jgi:hypothetical protein
MRPHTRDSSRPGRQAARAVRDPSPPRASQHAGPTLTVSSTARRKEDEPMYLEVGSRTHTASARH